MPRRSRTAAGATRAVASEATRRAILDAASGILAARDEDQLAIRDVCAVAGVTAPTIYHHFVDRQTLIDRVVEDCFASFDRWLVDRPPPLDPVDALHWGFDRYVEFGVAHPIPYRLMFGRRRVRPSAPGLVAYDRLRRGMQEVAAVGRLEVAVEEATLAYWSAVHGVTALAVLGILAPTSPVVALAREAIVARLTRPAPRAGKSTRTSERRSKGRRRMARGTR